MATYTVSYDEFVEEFSGLFQKHQSIAWKDSRTKTALKDKQQFLNWL